MLKTLQSIGYLIIYKGVFVCIYMWWESALVLTSEQFFILWPNIGIFNRYVFLVKHISHKNSFIVSLLQY